MPYRSGVLADRPVGANSRPRQHSGDKRKMRIFHAVHHSRARTIAAETLQRWNISSAFIGKTRKCFRVMIWA